MATHETDSELIRDALTGSRPAAERLMARHRQRVIALAYRALGNADDAQDVAQEALVYAHLRLPQLREHAKFAGWIAQITLTLCADYRRRRSTRAMGESLLEMGRAGEEERHIERIAINDAVARLSETHRTTLLLYYSGGWSLSQVADLLEVPVNTVRSRLMAAKRQLRAELSFAPPQRKPMATKTTALSEAQLRLIETLFPKARVLAIEGQPEPWQPFAPRVRLALPGGAEKTVDFRGDIDPARSQLISTLRRLGIPGPRVLGEPAKYGKEYLTLCEPPEGENLTLWALGGTPHRLHLATERAFEGIDRLQGATQALLQEPIWAQLVHRTLLDEAQALLSEEKWQAHEWLNWPESVVGEWRKDSWFVQSARKVEKAVADIEEPLVLTSYLHFFPQNYRIVPAAGAVDSQGPLLWPGDDRFQHAIAEFTIPYGHLGDPLLGLSMVWVYDCYPFVHTGFVEQFLLRRGASRREFAPRLALMALQTLARQLPVAPADKNGWWHAVRGYAEQALAWM